MLKQKVLKVKAGMLEEWKAWCSELQNERHEEARATLEEEGLEYETAGLFRLDDNYYVIATVYGEAKASDKSKEINRTHLEKRRKCLEPVSDVEVLYLLQS
jgi:hypothetical protein